MKDLTILTPKEREKYLVNKLNLNKGDTDIYCYPKAKKDWDLIAESFNKHYYCNSAEKSKRLAEWGFLEKNFGGEFGLLFDYDGFSMELDFECPEFIELPKEMQIACCNADWVVSK